MEKNINKIKTKAIGYIVLVFILATIFGLYGSVRYFKKLKNDINLDNKKEDVVLINLNNNIWCFDNKIKVQDLNINFIENNCYIPSKYDLSIKSKKESFDLFLNNYDNAHVLKQYLSIRDYDNLNINNSEVIKIFEAIRTNRPVKINEAISIINKLNSLYGQELFEQISNNKNNVLKNNNVQKPIIDSNPIPIEDANLAENPLKPNFNEEFFYQNENIYEGGDIHDKQNEYLENRVSKPLTIH